MFGARVRLTGQVAINDEQFMLLGKGMLPNLAATALAVLFILWLALRSAHTNLAVFISLCVGFVVTAAAGLLMVGAFNLISVAFGILFIGLGADFCIQFTVRYRSERHERDEVRAALRGAASRAGGPLALAAAGTMVGFFAFVPTAYRGIAELGLIAGFGMIAAFVTTITLLPALLTVFGTPGEPERMGFVALAPADRFLARHRIVVVAGTIIVVLAGMPLLSQMRFDFDPIHLQDPNGEAVSTYRELITVPELGISSVNIVAPSVTEVGRISQRVVGLPEVAETRSIHNLVPSDQDQKLPVIQRAAAALGPAINPSAIRPAPSDEQSVGAIRAAATNLRRLATAGEGDAAAASRLSDLLYRLADADIAVRDKARDVLIAPLRVELDRLRNMLRPERVTARSVPPELARDWVAPDGRARIEVLPGGDPNDTATLRGFAAAVLAIAPDVTGTPVWLIEAEHTVVRAFIEAGALAVLVIAMMLWIALRRFGDVLLTLVPLIVAGAVTLEVMVLTGESLNFANVIALPLLLGVGVAFKIYYIMAWRAGRTNLLQSTLTRAVFFSALTTETAFGSLWLSDQPGMASMGKLMALALLCTLAAAVLFQPALMGPPRGDNARNVA
jgi:hopanoid biosynthesis associated RND transporter like protein HpnN